MPEGTPITTRGLRIVRSHRCVREMKWLSIRSVISKSAMTPSFNG